MNKRISVLVVLVLLFQYPVLVLIFKQKLLVLSGGWGVSPVFFLSFSVSSLVSSSLSEIWLVLRFQRSALWPTSCSALELGFHCVGLLGAYFFALRPFSGASSEIHQPALCFQHFMLVCWLFFNFAILFDFGCCSRVQEMSFVNCYLPYFSQWLITCPLSALCISSLFLESLCVSPTFSGALRAPCPLCWVSFSIPCLLFRFFCLFVLYFFARHWPVCPGCYAGLSQG
jgi:hypothetical protein